MSEHVHDNTLTLVERLLQAVSGEGQQHKLDVRWSVVGTDPLVTITSKSGSKNSLAMRVSDEMVLLDIDNSQALEFATADAADLEDLERVVRGVFSGNLEVQVGSRDGKYYRLRGIGFDFVIPQTVLGGLMSGGRSWKRVGGWIDDPHSTWRDSVAAGGRNISAGSP